MNIDFAAPASGGFRFGLCPALAATELRKMADDIEKGEYLVQVMIDSTEVKPDEFLKHSLLIQYCKRAPLSKDMLASLGDV